MSDWVRVWAKWSMRLKNTFTLSGSKAAKMEENPTHQNCPISLRVEISTFSTALPPGGWRLETEINRAAKLVWSQRLSHEASLWRVIWSSETLPFYLYLYFASTYLYPVHMTKSSCGENPRRRKKFVDAPLPLSERNWDQVIHCTPHH